MKMGDELCELYEMSSVRDQCVCEMSCVRDELCEMNCVKEVCVR